MIKSKPITLFVLLMLGCSSWLFAQGLTISGTVTDNTGVPLAGVNVVIKNRVMGTVTDANGKYSLTIADASGARLVFSYIGYKTQEFAVSSAQTTIDVKMEEQAELGQEVIVSASRVEESIMKSPVTIEKMGILDIQTTPAPSFYQALSNLKGIDVSQNSINFPILNARGFNSTGNLRFVQLNDWMDTQAPGLNFPIANLNGPSDLDVESMEFVPGASSALYGPSAFNGALLLTSKSPFEYQGLSAQAKFGVNHLNGNSYLNNNGAPGAENGIGPGKAQPMQDYAFRYAKAFNNRFAFKVGFSYSQAKDWYGTNGFDRNATIKPSNLTNNPGTDRPNFYGDEASVNIAAVGFAQSTSQIWDPVVVSRTPYMEQDIVDLNAKNLKVMTALHYRITDKMELIGQWNYGQGTSVYTGAQRYSLKNFSINQAKIELKGDNFFIRAYTTIENAGDSYIGEAAAVGVNSLWKNNNTWFSQYGYSYTAGKTAGLSLDDAHATARTTADQGRLLPGTSAFSDALNKVSSTYITDGGAKLYDKSALYHLQGQYNFKKLVKNIDLIAGGSYRVYDLNSKGTIFNDTPGNNITIQEIGLYAQAIKQINDKFRVNASARYDKNENFDGRVTPRISLVYSPDESNNFRFSFQSGFRNPSTQDQHINLDAGSSRLIGGLPYYQQKFNVFVPGQTFETSSVQAYQKQVFQRLGTVGGLAVAEPSSLQLLKLSSGVDRIRPEQVNNFEVGYKAIVAKKLMIDIAYYYNSFTHFSTSLLVTKASGVLDLSATTITAQNVRTAQSLLLTSSSNTYSVPTNINDKRINAHGIAFGWQWSLPGGYLFSGNYNFNQLITDLGEKYISTGYNTPKNKFNVGIGNRRLTKDVGFNINYRWQSSFDWYGSFGNGNVPAVGTVDAQVSYRLSNLKTIVKIGGSNIFNERYVYNYGGPTIGGVYYLTLTFDELFRK